MPGSLDTGLAPGSSVHGVPFSLPHSCPCSGACRRLPAAETVLSLVRLYSCPLPSGRHQGMDQAAAHPVAWPRCRLPHHQEGDCPIIGWEKLETLSPAPFWFSNGEIWPWASLCHILLADPFMYYGFCSLVPKMRTQRI